MTKHPTITLYIPILQFSSHASIPHCNKPPSLFDPPSLSTCKTLEVEDEGESYEDERIDEQRKDPKVGAREGKRVKRDRVKVRRRVKSKSAKVETAKTL